MPESQPLLLSTADLLHPQGKRFWLEDTMFPFDKKGMHVPRFSVQEASKSFFGKDPDWLRWRMRPDKPSEKTGKPKHPEGFFILDGKPLEFKRLKSNSEDPNKVTARYYTLADIERMAHALAQQHIIDGLRLANIVLMVRCCARLYGMEAIPEVFEVTGHEQTEEAE